MAMSLRLSTLHMGIIAPRAIEDWRRGRVSYLERVITCNLSRLSRILRCHAHDLGLAPSVTVYRSRGNGPGQRLRFAKNGEPALEEAYARHFARNRKRGGAPLDADESRKPTF